MVNSALTKCPCARTDQSTNLLSALQMLGWSNSAVLCIDPTCCEVAETVPQQLGRLINSMERRSQRSDGVEDTQQNHTLADFYFLLGIK